MDKLLVPEYRERYEDVVPGWHMSKTHWNTVNFEAGSIPRKELLWMVDHSYSEVVKGLPKKVKEELNSL